MNVRGAKQHFSIQALQICDAFLIWLGFVIASFVRGPIREVLGMPLIADDGFKGTVWIIFIVVPLTPLVLERFGFYDRLLSRKRFQSSSILLRAMLAVVLIIALIAVFGKYSGTKRLVLGSGLLFSSGFLWIRSTFWEFLDFPDFSISAPIGAFDKGSLFSDDCYEFLATFRDFARCIRG